MNNIKEHKSMSVPLIDEVRAIRKALSDEFGNDIGKLAEHCRKVGEEYRNKTGRFAQENFHFTSSNGSGPKL